MKRKKDHNTSFKRGAAFAMISKRNRVHTDKKKKDSKNSCRKKDEE